MPNIHSFEIVTSYKFNRPVKMHTHLSVIGTPFVSTCHISQLFFFACICVVITCYKLVILNLICYVYNVNDLSHILEYDDF